MESEKEHLSEYFDGGYLPVSYQLIQTFGFRKAGFITKLYEQKRFFIKKGLIKEGEDFYLLQSVIHNQIKINPETQTRYIKELIEKGILSVRKEGVPSRNFYFIHTETLLNMVSKKCGNCKETIKTIDIINNPEIQAMQPGNPSYNKININKENIVSKETINRPSVGLELLEREKLESKPGVKIKRDKTDYFGKSEDIQEIFTYWNNLGKPLSKHKFEPTSKTFQNIIKDTKKVLETYSKDQIISSINIYFNFMSELKNNFYNYKIKLENTGIKVGLSDFFEASDFIHQNMKSKQIKIYSWFKECCQYTLEELKEKYRAEPKEQKLLPDVHPEITKVMKDEFYELIDKKDFTAGEENFLRKTSDMVYNYFIKLKDFKNDMTHKKKFPYTCAGFVVQALIKENPKTTNVPPFFGSVYFFENTVTPYLTKIGYLQDGWDDYVERPLPGERRELTETEDEKQERLEREEQKEMEIRESALTADDFL